MTIFLLICFFSMYSSPSNTTKLPSSTTQHHRTRRLCGCRNTSVVNIKIRLWCRDKKTKPKVLTEFCPPSHLPAELWLRSANSSFAFGVIRRWRPTFCWAWPLSTLAQSSKPTALNVSSLFGGFLLAALFLFHYLKQFVCYKAEVFWNSSIRQWICCRIRYFDGIWMYFNTRTVKSSNNIS